MKKFTSFLLALFSLSAFFISCSDSVEESYDYAIQTSYLQDENCAAITVTLPSCVRYVQVERSDNLYINYQLKNSFLPEGENIIKDPFVTKGKTYTYKLTVGIEISGVFDPLNSSTDTYFSNKSSVTIPEDSTAENDFTDANCSVDFSYDKNTGFTDNSPDPVITNLPENIKNQYLFYEHRILYDGADIYFRRHKGNYSFDSYTYMNASVQGKSLKAKNAWLDIYYDPNDFNYYFNPEEELENPPYKEYNCSYGYRKEIEAPASKYPTITLMTKEEYLTPFKGTYCFADLKTLTINDDFTYTVDSDNIHNLKGGSVDIAETSKDIGYSTDLVLKDSNGSTYNLTKEADDCFCEYVYTGYQPGTGISFIKKADSLTNTNLNNLQFSKIASDNDSEHYYYGFNSDSKVTGFNSEEIGTYELSGNTITIKDNTESQNIILTAVVSNCEPEYEGYPRYAAFCLYEEGSVYTDCTSAVYLN